jgi:hypothetical protein
MGVIHHCHILDFLFFLFQRDVLNFFLPTDKYCAHAGVWPIQLQERPPKERVQASTVSEDEDSAELIIPDCQDGASGTGDIGVLPEKEIMC